MEKKEKPIGNMTIQELRKIINKEVNKILIRTYCPCHSGLDPESMLYLDSRLSGNDVNKRLSSYLRDSTLGGGRI